MTVAPNARKSNTFDTLKDFAPVSLISNAHLAIAVGAGVPVKNLGEYIAWAKQNPGKAFYATSGAGTLPHMLVCARAGGSRTWPKGTGLIRLIGGQVPSAFDAMGDLSEQHKAGRIRIIASAGAARSKAMPEIPTLREQGYNIEGAAWFGLFAPGPPPPARV